MSPCQACGALEQTRAAYPSAARQANALGFERIALCARCGMGVAEPRQEQAALDAFYARGGYWDAGGAAPAQSAHARNQCLHRARFAAGRTPPVDRIRVLDVGGGEGWLGPALRQGIGARVAEYHCVEPDPRVRERPEPPDGPRRRSLETLAEAEGPYEMVFLNQVLEHVADPLALLRAAAALLSAEGILYVESPNADYRFKADVFPHTLFFTGEALQRLAERAGLETSVCESFGRSATRPSGAGDLVARAGYRVSVAVGASAMAQRFDDAYWNYSPRGDGLWLRWLGRKPA